MVENRKHRSFRKQRVDLKGGHADWCKVHAAAWLRKHSEDFP